MTIELIKKIFFLFFQYKIRNLFEISYYFTCACLIAATGIDVFGACGGGGADDAGGVTGFGGAGGAWAAFGAADGGVAAALAGSGALGGASALGGAAPGAAVAPTSIVHSLVPGVTVSPSFTR